MAKVKKRSTVKIWCDVIFAIFLREIKSKFNDKFGLSWALLSPMIMIVALVLIRGALDSGQTHGMPTIFFIVYGVALVQFFLGTLEAVSSSIQKNKPLYAFRQVQPISSVLALSGFELLTKIVLVAVLLIIGFFLRHDVSIDNPLLFMLVIFQTWVIATSLGLLFALAKCYVPEVSKIQAVATRPIFFISGIFFSIQDVPPTYWVYLDWNPLLHAVELLRFYSHPNYGNLGVSLSYLNASTIVCLFFALVCYKSSWKQAISR